MTCLMLLEFSGDALAISPYQTVQNWDSILAPTSHPRDILRNK